MTTGDAGIKGGNAIAQYESVSKRTKEISVTLSDTPPGWSETMNKVIFYADSADNWRMKFNICGSITSTASESFDITGIVFEAGGNQAVTTLGGASPYTGICNASGSGNTLSFFFTGAGTPLELSGDVALNAEPTTYTTLANLETRGLDQHFNEADDTNAGLLGYYEEASIDLSTDANFTSGILKLVRVGKAVTLSGTSKVVHPSSDGVVTATVTIPSNFRPSNTTDPVRNTFYHDAQSACNISINTDGKILLFYRNDSGNVSRTDTGSAPIACWTTL